MEVYISIRLTNASGEMSVAMKDATHSVVEVIKCREDE